MAQLAETDLISLMLAISSDEKKNARMQEILDALKAHDEAKATAETLVSDANQARVDATRIRSEAEAIRQTMVGREVHLLDFEKRLGDVNVALITEKSAWEKIRQQVDAEQKEAAERLAKWELDLKTREDSVTSREVGAKARELAANKRMDEADAKIAALRAALEAVDPAPKQKPGRRGNDEAQAK